MSNTILTNAEVAEQIHKALLPLQVVAVDDELPDETPVGRMRRFKRAGREDKVGIVTLLDVDGVLLWEDGAVNVSNSMRRRRGGGSGVPMDGYVVTQLKYEKPLGLNSIIAKLNQLDAELTPRAKQSPTPGVALLEYDQRTWTATPGAIPAAAGRILLFVHGTFSNTEKIVSELRRNDAGSEAGAFLAKVKAAGYTQVLGFDHYTVSRTPMVNAVELARLFADRQAEIDIVCHSRGGLVSRWFCEMLDRRQARRRRVVFIGCPLQGTSLADPQSLRHGINLMTNVGKILGGTFALVPFLAAASGLMQILSAIGNFASKSPLVDAGIGLIPGVSAMSRIQNNAELNALNYGRPVARSDSGSDYFAVSSTFRTDAAGWRFWRLFNNMKAADLAADYLVFRQDNDLVVDTDSMTFHAFGENPDLADTKIFCRFDETSQVHHTAYFRDHRTLDFLRESFGL
jgi:hypothetical protein